MARLHGRNGRLYIGIASGGTAEPIAFFDKWQISAKVQDADVTAFGDGNLVYVAGLPDSQGSFGGWYDDATAQVYTAARDGVARKFYLYPSIVGTPGQAQYFFGTAIFDMDISAAVNGGVAISGTWKASSDVNKVG